MKNIQSNWCGFTYQIPPINDVRGGFESDRERTGTTICIGDEQKPECTKRNSPLGEKTDFQLIVSLAEIVFRPNFGSVQLGCLGITPAIHTHIREAGRNNPSGYRKTRVL